MAQKITLYDKIDYEWLERLEGTCPINSYRTASFADVPLSDLPSTLTKKVPAVCLVNSGDLYCFSYFMIGLHRKDKQRFDRQPLIIQFNRECETAVAGFVDHLRCDGARSSYDPNVMSGLLAVADASGLVRCENYWLRKTQGSLDNFALHMPQEKKVFESSVAMLNRLIISE